MELNSAARAPLFVKLGGSLITDKSRPYTPRQEVIERLCDEIHQARCQPPRPDPGANGSPPAPGTPRPGFPLLVGHGGGSFPHVSASRYGTADGVVDSRSWEGFVKVHDDAARLNALVCRCLTEAGELVMPVQPSAACVARDRRIIHWDTEPLDALLRAGVLPVPHGDVCVDRAQGCCIISTEEIFRHLAQTLRPRRVLLVGKVDGVLDRQGRPLPRISHDNLERVRELLAPSDGVADVTGGMLHKVQRSLELGLPTQIINGLVPGLLQRALLGEDVQGTTIY